MIEMRDEVKDVVVYIGVKSEVNRSRERIACYAIIISYLFRNEPRSAPAEC
jgi:hypothetical protein